MRISWGTGIAIVLGLFAIVMGFAVYKAVQQDYDLVTSDYYAEELAYQERIDQKKNALTLEGHMKLTWTEKGLVMEFPSDLIGHTVSTKIDMYCVTEKDYDFSMNEDNWELSDLAIPADKFEPGKWIAKVTITDSDKAYYFDPEVVIQ